MNEITFQNPNVRQIFESYSQTMQAKLLALRDLIFEVASKTDGVGELEETLKWGQIAYLTSQSKSGSTIRIDRLDDHHYAMFFICHTKLVETFKTLFGGRFTYDGDRCLIFDVNIDPPDEELKHCVSMALTYHKNKKNL